MNLRQVLVESTDYLCRTVYHTTKQNIPNKDAECTAQALPSSIRKQSDHVPGNYRSSGNYFCQKALPAGSYGSSNTVFAHTDGAIELPGEAARNAAFLDASILLAKAAGCSRSVLLASLEDDCPEILLATYQQLLEERALGASIAYILGHKDFWKYTFAVAPGVLVPRPETEKLVELCIMLGDVLEESRKNLPQSEPIKIHDLCTGSGCIAISIARDRQHWLLSASDISWQALDVAKDNARDTANCSVFYSDLFSECHSSYDIIVSNPPYLTTEETRDILNQGSREPALALDGGADGLDLVRAIIAQAPARLKPQGFLLVEIDPAQSLTVVNLFQSAGFVGTKVHTDLAGHARIVCGQLQ